MLWLIFFGLWFFMPAGVANATPVLSSKLPLLKDWNAPMDLGLKWRGKRLLGPNKTWRGLLTGVVIGSLFGLLQAVLFNLANSIPQAVFLAALMSTGALLGDAVESFIKRQCDVPSGQSWFPFDQTDYIIGGLALIYPFAHPSLSIILIIFGGYFGLHLIVRYFGYLIGVNADPI